MGPMHKVYWSVVGVYKVKWGSELAASEFGIDPALRADSPRCSTTEPRFQGYNVWLPTAVIAGKLRPNHYHLLLLSCSFRESKRLIKVNVISWYGYRPTGF